MSEKITSWSFSRWSKYEACPRAAKYAYIDKIKEPSSPALERGTQLHELCEHYLRGIKKTMPKELKLIEGELKTLKKAGALAEAEFTFTNEWRKTGWFDRDAWVRIKADAVVVPKVDGEVEIIDFKSGKVREGASEYMLQLELYALAGLLTYPTAAKAKTRLVFIDHGRVIPHEQEFSQADVAALQKAWLTRTKKMLSDIVYKPTPGNACRWCFFRKSNKDNGGGQCEF